MNVKKQENTAYSVLSIQQEKRLKQMGATVRNGYNYKKLKLKDEREKVGRSIIGNMSVEQLSDMMSFYLMMAQFCSQLLEDKLQIINLDFATETDMS